MTTTKVTIPVPPPLPPRTSSFNNGANATTIKQQIYHAPKNSPFETLRIVDHKRARLADGYVPSLTKELTNNPQDPLTTTTKFFASQGSNLAGKTDRMSAVAHTYERFSGDITDRETLVFASAFGPTTKASQAASNEGKLLRTQQRVMQAASQQPSTTAIKNKIDSGNGIFDKKAFIASLENILLDKNRAGKTTTNAKPELVQPKAAPSEKRTEAFRPEKTFSVNSTNMEKQETVPTHLNAGNANDAITRDQGTNTQDINPIITRDQSNNTFAMNEGASTSRGAIFIEEDSQATQVIARNVESTHSSVIGEDRPVILYSSEVVPIQVAERSNNIQAGEGEKENSFGNSTDVQRHRATDTSLDLQDDLSSVGDSAQGEHRNLVDNNEPNQLDNIDNAHNQTELNTAPVQEVKQKHTHRMSDNAFLAAVGTVTLLVGALIDILGFVLRGESSTVDTDGTSQLTDIPADLQQEISSLENSVALEDQISSALNDIAIQCENNAAQITEVADRLSSAQDQILSDIEQKAYDTAQEQAEAAAFADPNNQQMTVDDYGNLVPTGQLTNAAIEECEQQATQIAQQAKNMASTVLTTTVDQINAKAADISQLSNTLANASTTTSGISQSTQTVINNLDNVEQTVSNNVNNQTNVTQSGISHSGLIAMESIGSFVALFTIPIVAKLLTNIHHNELAAKQRKDQSVNSKASAIQNDIVSSENVDSLAGQGGNVPVPQDNISVGELRSETGSIRALNSQEETASRLGSDNIDTLV